ncbi:MAG: hypothetical protein ACM3NW_12255 [Syntrophomonadaceae bacterium]
MRTYLGVSGVLFGLFAATHSFIAWQHAHGATEWRGWPALVAVASAALAAWAFRLLRGAPPARS